MNALLVLGLFSFFAFGVYLTLHFLSHGPLLIYPDQWKSDPREYEWNDDRPSVPGWFALWPALLTPLYLLPLLWIPSIGNPTINIVFLFLASFILSRSLFSIVNNRESARFYGFSLGGLYDYAKEWTVETVKDIWLRGFYKLFLLFCVWVVSLVPFLNLPFPYYLGAHPSVSDGAITGMPIAILVLLILLFTIRWSTYSYTISKAYIAGYANRRHVIIHFCTLLAFIIFLLYLNTLYAYGGFAMADFASMLPLVIGGLLGAVFD